MSERQERLYEMMLSNLGILSPQQLDKIQNVIRSMLQDLEMENEVTEKIKYL